MDTDRFGALRRVRQVDARTVQLVYEKGVVVKTYHTQLQAQQARTSWGMFVVKGREA